jgi:hypothetical protein
MVLPRGITDPNLGGGEQAPEEVGPHLECSAAPQSLDGGDPTVLQCGALLAEDQLLHCLAIVGDARHWKIGPGTLALWPSKALLSLLDGLKDGKASFFIEVDPDAEVDLLCALVAMKVLVEAENRIAWVDGCVFEHGRNATGRLKLK